MPIAQIREVNIHHQVFVDTGPWFAFVTGGRRGFSEFVPLLPFSDWAPHEPAMAREFVDFKRHVSGAAAQPQ